MSRALSTGWSALLSNLPRQLAPSADGLTDQPQHFFPCRLSGGRPEMADV